MRWFIFKQNPEEGCWSRIDISFETREGALLSMKGEEGRFIIVQSESPMIIYEYIQQPHFIETIWKDRKC
jgi:hypothetical protein